MARRLIRTGGTLGAAAALTLSGVVPAVATPTAAPTTNSPKSVPTACSASATTPGSGKRARYLWYRLTQAGYSPQAAAGVLGNLDYDSGLVPVAFGTTADRIGIAQWPRERWRPYLDQVLAAQGNPWSLKRQVNYLIRDMAADPGAFRHAKFMKAADPVSAAVRFHKRYNPSGADNATARATRGVKATSWFQILSTKPEVPHDSRLTYGTRVNCAPPAAKITKCPVVPDVFKEKFRNDTGFEWDAMSENARRMSRCVYANFPHILTHGTYNGHMPTWSQAIDFMMPEGCLDSDQGAMTRSETDFKVGNRLARYLFDNADRLGIDYMIWQDSIRNPDERPEENAWAPIANWRDDNYNNGNCTNAHFDHVHVSVYSDGLAASLQAQTQSVPEGQTGAPVAPLELERAPQHR